MKKYLPLCHSGLSGIFLVFMILFVVGCATIHVNTDGKTCKADYFSFMKNLKTIQASACGLKIGAESSTVDTTASMLLGEGLKSYIDRLAGKIEPSSSPKGTNK